MESIRSVKPHFGSAVALRVHRGAAFQQKFHQSAAPIGVGRGSMQRGETGVIRNVDIRAFGEQHTRHLQVVNVRRLVQNANVARIARIDIGTLYDHQPGRFDRTVIGGGDEQWRAARL